MRSKDGQGKICDTLKILISIASVMVMFGLSWLFGALSVDKAAIVFQWFFVLFSTSQGFLLFIFFCVIDRDARKEWIKLLTFNRYYGKKKGGAIPSSSYASVKTIPTSKVESSVTTRPSFNQKGVHQKGVKFDSHGKKKAEFDVNMTKDLNKKTEEDTQLLLISNDFAEHTGSSQRIEKNDSQVPPQILFRLKRPNYDLVLEQDDDNSPNLSVSSELSTFTAVIDIDEYGKHNSDYEQSDRYSDLDYTEL